MPKFLTTKQAMLIGALLLSGGFYAYHARKVDSLTHEAFEIQSQNTAATVTPVPTDIPSDTTDTLLVRGIQIKLGDSSESVVKALGTPGRIDATEYTYDYYVYNNDYSHLVFVAIEEDKVVGFYTDSIDFLFHGIQYGDSLTKINKALGKNYSEGALLTYEGKTYTATILMDQLETNTVTGIYLQAKEPGTKGSYTDEAVRNIEQMVYDITNSIRKRHGQPILSWSSSAGQAARKHSEAMASKEFFDHIDPEFRTPGGRLFAEGIGYSECSENIIGGYEDAILSCHALYNSRKQRQNILHPEYRYLGAGFSYLPDSPYATYLTQVFYR